MKTILVTGGTVFVSLGSRRILCSKRMGGLRAEPEQQEAAEGCEAD